MYLCIVLLCLPRQESSEELVKRLVDGFTSDDVEARRLSEEEIRRLGVGAGAALLKLSAHPDPEVSARAVILLRALELRSALSDRLLAASPGIEDRLVRGGLQAWTRELCALLAAPRGVLALYPEDLEVLIPKALQGAQNTEELLVVVQAIGKYNLSKAQPHVVGLLRHRSARVRGEAVKVLGVIGEKDALDGIRQALEDDSVFVRTRAISAFGRVGGANSEAERIAAFLNKSDSEAGAAALALADLGARQTAARISNLLQAPESFSRWTACHALGELQYREALSDIAVLTRDDDSTVREFAVASIGRLGGSGELATVLPLLRDPASSVRVAAIASVGKLGKELAIAHLDTPSESWGTAEKRAAVAALTAIERGTIAALNVYLRDADKDIQLSAAKALCVLGVDVGVPIILESGKELSCLNALRTPEVSRRLMRLMVSAPIRGKPKSILERILTQAGLRLRWEALEDERHALSWIGQWHVRSKPQSAMQISEWIELVGECGVIFEAEEVRVVSGERAVQFWKDWCASRSK